MNNILQIDTVERMRLRRGYWLNADIVAKKTINFTRILAKEQCESKCKGVYEYIYREIIYNTGQH